MAEPIGKQKSNENSEKRRENRISYDFPVFFYFISGKRKPRSVIYNKGWTINVSKNGLKLFVDSLISENKGKIEKPDSELGLEIYLPAVFRSKPISCRGKIVWWDRHEESKDSYLIGVELKNLDKQTRDTLKGIAKTLRKISDDILEEDEF